MNTWHRETVITYLVYKGGYETVCKRLFYFKFICMYILHRKTFGGMLSKWYDKFFCDFYFLVCFSEFFKGECIIYKIYRERFKNQKMYSSSIL